MGFRRTGPNENSIAARLVGFFAANPEEELTYHDIMVKFDCNRPAAWAAVRSLSKRVEVDTTVRLRKEAP